MSLDHRRQKVPKTLVEVQTQDAARQKILLVKVWVRKYALEVQVKGLLMKSTTKTILHPLSVTSPQAT